MSRDSFGCLKKATTAAAIALTQLIAAVPLGSLAAGSVIRVAGHDAFTIPVGSGKMTVQERANVVQRNLDNALVASHNRAPAAVKITYVNGLPVITLGGYQVVTVDSASAKAARTSPAVLASRWVDGIRGTLNDAAGVSTYVAHLTGTEDSGTANLQSSTTSLQSTAQPRTVHRGRVVYVPQGMVLPVRLTTGLSSEIAQPGDRVEARVSQSVSLENGVIPEGSIVYGQVVDSTAGKRLAKSGGLTLRFTSLRTPDGAETPITAHLMGSVGKYSQAGSEGSGAIKGETTKNKVQSAAIRGAIGVGGGALLGTTIGAIAGGGHGAGRGAWSGAAIGGALGVANSLLLRKGANVKLESGQQLDLQLDAPAQLASYGTGNL